MSDRHPAGSGSLRTGLVVIASELEQRLLPFRTRHLPDAVRRRLPAHVTVLFPFAPAAELDERLLGEAREHFAARPSFGARVERTATFPEHVWLVPEPRQAFLDLLGTTHRRFPAYPPYGRALTDPEPHLTLGEVTAGHTLEELQEAASAELAADLPLTFRVGAVTLIVEREDGIWERREVFPLAE
ncbi:MAG: 2'-5' RNA ligase family protein [Gaiella sp.]